MRPRSSSRVQYTSASVQLQYKIPQTFSARHVYTHASVILIRQTVLISSPSSLIAASLCYVTVTQAMDTGSRVELHGDKDVVPQPYASFILPIPTTSAPSYPIPQSSYPKPSNTEKNTHLRIHKQPQKQWRCQRSKGARSFRGQKILQPGHPDALFSSKKN